MPLLDDATFRKTCAKKMSRVSADGNAPFPFWWYFEKIPVADFQGYDCSDERVQWIWRDDEGCFEHIYIDTKEDRDVFMTIVLDLKRREVVGHRLMDFKREYGLRE